MYRKGHPWVGDHELAPKSVVRDMYERAMTFTEYVSFYGLTRSEGLVLRYLADAYKALRQTVPEEAKTEELIDLIEWLGELVRQVDSSLIDEWERLRNPTDEPSGASTSGRRRSPATSARSGSWCATRCSAGSSWPRCSRYDELGELDADAGLGRRGVGRRDRGLLRRVRRSRCRPGRARPGAGARSRPGRASGRYGRSFDDPAGDRDWGISAEIDLAASDEIGAAVVRILDVGPN